MATTNSTLLKIMNIIFWIVFIGLCIKTGALLISFFVSLFGTPAAAEAVYLGLDLSDLYAYGEWHYIAMALLLIVLTGQKTYIAYLVIKSFMSFDLSRPFNAKLTGLFLQISHVALGAGILAVVATGYSKAMGKAGVAVPIDFSGGEILFFSGIIYLLALVFKKGADLQAENDLTV